MNFTDVRTAIELIFKRYIQSDNVDYAKLTDVAFNYHIEHSIRDEACIGFKCFCNPRIEAYNNELMRNYKSFKIPANCHYFVDPKYGNQDNVDEILTVDTHFQNLRIEVEDMFDQCQSEICKSRQYINDILDEININHDRNMFIFATIRHIIAIQNLSRSMMKITIFEYKNELTRMFKNQKDAREFNSKLSQYNTAIMDSDNSCRIF